MAAEPILIVLVEDDDGHATLVERNLTRVGVANSLVRLKDGQEALDFLRARNGSTSAQGRSRSSSCSTSRCRESTALKSCASSRRTLKPLLIPVIMLTTTDDPREVKRCYELGLQRLHHQTR